MDDLCMYVKRSVKMYVAFDSRLRDILTNVNVLNVYMDLDISINLSRRRAQSPSF
jgi:hypothetical protein